MAKAAIAVQQSRFALLKVEGSDDESDGLQGKQNQKSNKNGQLSANAKKKKNKKKKDAEAAELRNLAFGAPGKNKGGRQPSGKSSGAGDNGASEAQWEQWKKTDTEATQDAYQEDLQQAILQSKLEFELQKEAKAKEAPEENGKPSKKKNKKKSAMSLEEFNQKVESMKPKTRHTSDVDELGLNDLPPDSPPPKPKVKEAPTEPDPEFFKKVNKDASKIIERERIQEQYQKNYMVENARIQQFKDDLSKKDREIAMLRVSHDKLQEDLKTVKKRNQQLCFIIGQGEMKDKKTVLLELEEIKMVKDELKEQVASLTSDLEKERTKVHTLKDEMYKLKMAHSEMGQDNAEPRASVNSSTVDPVVTSNVVLGTRRPACLMGWEIAIHCLLQLWDTLKTQYGLKFLLTSRLNQDCVENLFGVIRAKGAGFDTPDAKAFRAFYSQGAKKRNNSESKGK